MRAHLLIKPKNKQKMSVEYLCGVISNEGEILNEDVLQRNAK